jgi:peptidoglycan/LPS O-acetylase OafA/YrhL
MSTPATTNTTAESAHSLHPDLRKGRILQLDVLRGIAILMVLWYHAVLPPEQSGRFYPFAALGARIGYSGVDLFFVLSGFLIGGLLFKEIRLFNALNIPRFWIRRGLKIWPAYYALLLVIFIRLTRHSGLHVALHQIWPSVFALQNYLHTAAEQIWSLAVEEHFYLLLPIVLVALPRHNRDGRLTIPALPALAATVCVAGFFLRVFDDGITDRTHLNIDAMFFGVLLAYCHQFHYDQFSRFTARPEPLLLIAAALLIPFLTNLSIPLFPDSTIHLTLYLAYGLILIALVQTPLDRHWLGKLLSSPPSRLIAFIGFYSYAIYLWFNDLVAQPMFYFLEHHLRHVSPTLLWPAAMLVYIAATTLVAVIMAKLIEIPMLALRNRWFPARAAITAISPSPGTPGEGRGGGLPPPPVSM